MGFEELTQEEVQAMLERERSAEPADQSILQQLGRRDAPVNRKPPNPFRCRCSPRRLRFRFRDHFRFPAWHDSAEPDQTGSQGKESDPFDEIDFGSFSMITSIPATRLHPRIGREALVRDVSFGARHAGRSPPVPAQYRNTSGTRPRSRRLDHRNLDDDGYLLMSVEEIAESGQHTIDDVKRR